MSEISTPSVSSLQKATFSDNVFKVPIGLVKKKKARVKVLDEDTYIEEMEKIIQRDFFPDLEKLKAQNDFLDATERKDYQKLRELYIKYSGGQRPPTERYASPATFETPRGSLPCTPLNMPSDTTELRDIEISRNENVSASVRSTEKSKPLVPSRHSLDSYLAAYTSEDNMSFQEIMENMGEKSREKFADQLQIEQESQLKMLTLSNVPSIEEQASQTERPNEIDTWSYKAKNYIMYVPDGETPSADEPARKHTIVHTNTRMEVEPFDYHQSKETITQIAKSQEKILSGRIGVDGSTLLDSKNKQNNNTSLGLGTITVLEGGMRLIPMSTAHSLVRTPSPCPGAPGESPLMTWGQIEGTPFRLDGGDTPLPSTASGTSFKMANTSKREQIALALAEKAGQRHRAQKKKAMEAAKRNILTPSPRMMTGSTTDRLASMSPAAQRLATTHLKRHLSGLSSPSPKLTPNSKSTTGGLTPLSSNLNSKIATPIVSRRRSDILPNTASDDKKSRKNLTDDLLQINLPKRNRLKASDFFA